MELLQLRHFCTVAYYQNVTRAAAELMISQPALSKTIRNLEQEVGARLFERRGKYIQLSLVGELFYQQVQQSLHILDDGLLKISDMADMPTGEVHILAQGASNFLVELYLRFQKKYPAIRLMISNQTQSDQLQFNDYDLTFSTAESFVPARDSVPLLCERMVLAMPADHPLAGRDWVDLKEAAPYPFVITNTYTYLQQLCRTAGFTPKVVTQCDNTFTFCRLMREGLGIAIVPQITIGEDIVNGMRLIPFQEPESTRIVVLTWNTRRYLSQAACLFRELTLEYFSEARKDSRALPLQTDKGDAIMMQKHWKGQIWADF